jgi:hypothetical protein
MDVVWEVVATGCTGRFRLAEHPQVKPFHSFAHYFRYYGEVKRVQETVTVQSIDGNGNVREEQLLKADPFTVAPEDTRFISPPADARAESVRIREDGLACRIEKESNLAPGQTNVNFRLIIDGKYQGANFNGYAATNNQVFSVPPNEYQVYRGIGVVFGKSGHAVCQAYFVAPRCQISLVENSFDLIRKKLQFLGRVERAEWDGVPQSIPKGSEFIVVDDVPTRAGKMDTVAIVYGPEGDQGTCAANFTIPPPELRVQPLRAIASSTWNDANPKKAIDGLTQQGWIAETKGRGWIRVDLGRNYKVSKVRLCVDQSKPGPSKHEIYIGRTEKELRKVASFDEVTAAGQWLEKLMNEKDIRYVEVKTLDTNSQVSWREIEIYECTTFRACSGTENGTMN